MPPYEKRGHVLQNIYQVISGLFLFCFSFFALLYFRDFRSNILIHEYDEIWKGFEATTEVFDKIQSWDRSLHTLSSKIGHMASSFSFSPVEERKIDIKWISTCVTYVLVGHFALLSMQRTYRVSTIVEFLL